MSKDQRLPDAIDTVARDAAWRALDHAELLERIEWADYPEVGEYDWQSVAARVQAIADAMRPTKEQSDAAREFLAARAERATA